MKGVTKTTSLRECRFIECINCYLLCTIGVAFVHKDSFLFNPRACHLKEEVVAKSLS